MKGPWLLLRSHSAPAYLLATALATVVGSVLGPDSRTVITRDGALGEPLPFVLALSGIAAMVCLVEPAHELVSTFPRQRHQSRVLLAGFVLTGSGGGVALTCFAASDLVAATARNVLVALAITFVAAVWYPLASWVPTSAYLALSWFYGTATYDHNARWWAVPAQSPDWDSTAYSAAVALVAAAFWVLAPLAPARNA